ncbi:uncharacterized [Tachysurus ichikawai]
MERVMGSATGPPAVLMSVTVWELRSQCASRSLLLLFLWEIRQEDEGRTERQDLSQGCQIFQDSLLRCVLLWLIHKEAMQIDDVAVLRELNLITGNKESGFEHQMKQHKLL